MSRRKEIALVTAGILAGIAVSGPATQAAAGLMANPSSQKFYLKDRQINLQAYEIGGSNYVKLRDIGQAVDFGVAYDAATNTVTISPDKPYETEVIPPASTPPDSQTSPSALSKNADGSINVPQDGSRYVPQEGDVIRCDDGTNMQQVYKVVSETWVDGGWVHTERRAATACPIWTCRRHRRSENMGCCGAVSSPITGTGFTPGCC